MSDAEKHLKMAEELANELAARAIHTLNMILRALLKFTLCLRSGL